MKNSNTHIKTSLRTKFSIIIFVMILLSGIVVGGINIKYVGEDMLGERALSIAQSVAGSIDVDEFKKLSISKDESDPYYSYMRNIMLKVLEKTQVRYLYALINYDDNNYMYIVNGNTGEEFYPIGSLESKDNYCKELDITYITGNDTYSRIYDAGEYGNLISAFVPIKNSEGKIVGIVGCDINAENVLVNTIKYIPKTILGTLISSIILFIIAFVYFTKNISQPLNVTSHKVRIIANGDFTEDMPQKYLKRNDEIGDLVNSFNKMTESIKEQADTAVQIAEGKDNIEINVHSDKDILALGLREIVCNNKKISKEIEHLAIEAAKGNLKVRVYEEDFKGSWKKLVQGLNILVEKVDKPISFAEEYIQKMANGEELEEINTEEYEGQYKILMKNLNNVRISLYAMLTESINLTKEAINGNLSYRADASELSGGFKQIVVGINQTLDAVIEPIKEASEVLEHLTMGDLNARVAGDYKGDHAEIKNALNLMGEEIQGYIDEVSNMLGSMADKNFTQNIEREYVGNFTQLKESINYIVNQLNAVLNEIYASAEQVEIATDEVAASSQNLSQGASEQTSSVEEISASITQIAEQTQLNCLNANQAKELSLIANEDAVKENEQMSEMLNAMAQIKESSKSISDIIKVIDDIAFQTNILALNAAVEAARAGEHGKGFAVVAEEVRNLAARSADAAKETTDLINNSINKVEVGYEIANITAEALSKIVVGTQDSVEIIKTIASASTEQSTAITLINEGIEQISQVTQDNTAIAEESASTSEEMAAQAQTLKQLIGEFELKKQDEKNLLQYTNEVKGFSSTIQNKY